MNGEVAEWIKNSTVKWKLDKWNEVNGDEVKLNIVHIAM